MGGEVGRFAIIKEIAFSDGGSILARATAAAPWIISFVDVRQSVRTGTAPAALEPNFPRIRSAVVWRTGAGLDGGPF